MKKFRIDENGVKTNFSKKEDSFIKEKYIEFSIKRISKELNRSECGVSNRIKSLGLKIPKDVFEKRIIDARFKKGIIPHNTGKKQKEWLFGKAYENVKKNHFVKNQIPKCALPLFSEVKRKEGDQTYIMIKVPEKTRLVYKHKYIWEKHNGKIPKGYIISFKNKNSEDCNIENLEIILREESILRNSKRHNYHFEQLGQRAKVAKLNRLIKNKK